MANCESRQFVQIFFLTCSFLPSQLGSDHDYILPFHFIFLSFNVVIFWIRMRNPEKFTLSACSYFAWITKMKSFRFRFSDWVVEIVVNGSFRGPFFAFDRCNLFTSWPKQQQQQKNDLIAPISLKFNANLCLQFSKNKIYIESIYTNRLLGLQYVLLEQNYFL